MKQVADEITLGSFVEYRNGEIGEVTGLGSYVGTVRVKFGNNRYEDLDPDKLKKITERKELFTGGEWGTESCLDGSIFIKSGEKYIASLETEDGESTSETYANATLIIASKDMYIALKIVLWDMENGEAEAQRQGKPRYSERKEIILAAINKATPKK